MKTKILYEIRKYEQEILLVNGFEWKNIESGYTMNSDVFRNTDNEVIETFENEQDAKEKFKDYQSGVSGEIQMSLLNARIVFEFELAKVKYTYDDNGDVKESEVIKNEIADFSNYVIFKRDVEEELKYRLETYADSFDELIEELGSLDCKMRNKEEVKKGIDSLMMYNTYKFDCTYKDDYRFSVEFSYTLGFEDFIIYDD